MLECIVPGDLCCRDRQISTDKLISFFSVMPSINHMDLNSSIIELTLPLFVYLSQRPLVRKISLVRPPIFGFEKDVTIYEILRNYLVQMDTRRTRIPSSSGSSRAIAHPVFLHPEVPDLMSPIEFFGALQSPFSNQRMSIHL